MKLLIFSVYDTKLAAFLPPFTVVAPVLAHRAFTQIANDGESQISNHPEDFTLYQVGQWDDETGEFTSTKHINHGKAANYKVRHDGQETAPQPLSDASHLQRGAKGANTA